MDPAILHRIGLRPGEPVRFRRADGGKWFHGRMATIAADGSLTLHDANGAARSIRPERVEVRRPGSRGRLSWQLVSDVAITWEQLSLFTEDIGDHRLQRRTGT